MKDASAAASAATADAVPNLMFSHMGFAVSDLAKMEDFYSRVLGFTVTDRGEVLGMDLVFLSRDPLDHHQVVLTWFYMKARNIPVKGIIFNHFHRGDIMEEDNLRMCEYMTGLKVLACVADGDTQLNMELSELTALYE